LERKLKSSDDEVEEGRRKLVGRNPGFEDFNFKEMDYGIVPVIGITDTVIC